MKYSALLLSLALLPGVISPPRPAEKTPAPQQSEAAASDAGQAEEVLNDGVIRRPPLPPGCEGLRDVIRGDVERSVKPLRDALRTICSAVSETIDAVRRFLQVVCLIVVVVGLLLVVVAWRVFLAVWRLAPLFKAIEEVLKR